VHAEALPADQIITAALVSLAVGVVIHWRRRAAP
jgi:hypothetical protein